MKHKTGVLLMVIGSVLIAAALSLFLFNQQEQQRAAQASDEAIPKVVHAIQERREEQNVVMAPVVPELIPNKVMPVAQIDGYDYIGFLGIPNLNLELPVMADWSYPQLKISPCRFTGDMYSDDLVVMAHNFERHFGGLRNLRVGDTVTFTDMDGITMEYEVAALDVLEPTAVEEMTAGEYDLTLFTCTYGGQYRVTVRCDQIKN